MMRKMQKELEKVQAELAEQSMQVTSGGGAVVVQITGDQKITSIKIDPDALDPNDVGMLEDMLVVGVNEAIGRSQELAAKKLGALTGGLKIPGLGL